MRAFLFFVGISLFVLLFSGGCETQYVPPQSPPEDYNDVKTLNLVLETEPAGAEIYATDSEGRKTRLGTSPMDLKLSFCEYEGLVWLKAPHGSDDTKWRESRLFAPQYHLYIGGQDFYSIYFYTYFHDKYLNTSSPSSRDVPLTDGKRIQPFGFPVKLVKHGRVFSREFTKVVNSDDYYGAEELRLRRIDELESIIKQTREAKERNRQEIYNWIGNRSDMVLVAYLTSYYSSGKVIIDEVTSKLMESEIDQLKHTVGLLDPQLMAMRKQLVEKLQAGDIETAFALAQGVSAMERRYFPEPPPQQIIVQAPAQPTIQSQVAQDQGKQEIVIQQKPYYGAQNIVEALGAMRGSKLNPEAYQKALGGAQLLDIMGFGSMINK
jgi:hypothetical protein